MTSRPPTASGKPSMTRNTEADAAPAAWAGACGQRESTGSVSIDAVAAGANARRA